MGSMRKRVDGHAKHWTRWRANAPHNWATGSNTVSDSKRCNSRRVSTSYANIARNRRSFHEGCAILLSKTKVYT
jgi:hypothetical protein